MEVALLCLLKPQEAVGVLTVVASLLVLAVQVAAAAAATQQMETHRVILICHIENSYQARIINGSMLSSVFALISYYIPMLLIVKTTLL